MLSSYGLRMTGKAVFFLKPISFKKQTEAIYVSNKNAW